MLWEFLLLGALPLYIFRKLKKLKKNEKTISIHLFGFNIF